MSSSHKTPLLLLPTAESFQKKQQLLTVCRPLHLSLAFYSWQGGSGSSLKEAQILVLGKTILCILHFIWCWQLMTEGSFSQSLRQLRNQHTLETTILTCTKKRSGPFPTDKVQEWNFKGSKIGNTWLWNLHTLQALRFILVYVSYFMQCCIWVLIVWAILWAEGHILIK